MITEENLKELKEILKADEYNSEYNFIDKSEKMMRRHIGRIYEMGYIITGLQVVPNGSGSTQMRIWVDEPSAYDVEIFGSEETEDEETFGESLDEKIIEDSEEHLERPSFECNCGRIFTIESYVEYSGCPECGAYNAVEIR